MVTSGQVNSTSPRLTTKRFQVILNKEADKSISHLHLELLSCIFHVLQDDGVHIDIADSANIVYLSCCICTCISSVLVVGFWTFIVTLYHALFLRFTINDTHAKFKKITCVKYRNVL